jgi:ketosteroid isomerase-like protein
MTTKATIPLTGKFPSPTTTLLWTAFIATAILVPSPGRPQSSNDVLLGSIKPDSAKSATQHSEKLATSKENNMTTKATIEGYFSSLKQKKGWESFLADDMVFTSFTSPVKQVSGKAAYLEATKRFYGGIVTFEIRDLLIDRDKACALTRYQLQRPQTPTFESDVAEVFRVRDGKIVLFNIYFDSAPFPK